MGPSARREWITKCEPIVSAHARDRQDGRKAAVSARHKEGAAAIPDAWDEETSSAEEDNQMIWDNACDIYIFFFFRHLR
jgi:hypothetical protein